GYLLADWRTDVVCSLSLAGFELVEAYQPFAAAIVQGECRSSAGSKCGMTAAGGCFDILRIDVSAANDDQVFQPSRNVQLGSENEPEIAGPQVGPLPVIRCESAKNSLGFLGQIPEPSCIARPGYPYLADGIRLTLNSRFRIDDQDRRALTGGAATD